LICCRHAEPVWQVWCAEQQMSPDMHWALIEHGSPLPLPALVWLLDPPPLVAPTHALAASHEAAFATHAAGA